MMTRFRPSKLTVELRVGAGVLTLSAVLGAVVPVAGKIPAALDPVVAIAGLLFVCLLGAAVSVGKGAGAPAGERDIRGIGGAAACTASVVAVVIPASELVAGTRVSKLFALGFPLVNAPMRISQACIIFMVALLAYVGGQLLASRRGTVRRPALGTDGPWLRRASEALVCKPVYLVLVVIGLLSLAATPAATQAALVNRGQATGQGVSVLLAYSAPLAVAIAVLRSHWGQRRWLLGSAAICLLLLNQGTRSPFLIVAAAGIVRLFGYHRAHPLTWRQVVAGGLLVYLALAMIVGISVWRSDKIIGTDASLPRSLFVALQDPFSGLSTGGTGSATGGAGLDTFDGLVLAEQVNPSSVDASPLDPIKAVTSFIPRQIWPSKPKYLGTVIANRYTVDSGRAGIFISGAGYAYVVYRSLLGVFLVFVILGYVCERLATVDKGRGIIALLLTLFVMRFFFEGDAYDLFVCLQLLVLSIFAFLLTRIGGVLYHLLGPARSPGRRWQPSLHWPPVRERR